MTKYILLAILMFAIPFKISAASGSTIKKVEVSTVQKLIQALNKANRSGGNIKIVIADGSYRLNKTLQIKAPNITLMSRSGDRSKVRLIGKGMRKQPVINNLLLIKAKHTTIRGLTLEQAGNHIIQITGKSDADHFSLINCHLRDSFQQLIKVSSHKIQSADYGIVRNSLFEYSAGIGPQWYIGGIDAHGAKNWHVKHNEFRNIASPSERIAEFAIHFWNGSSDNIVEDNLIIDSDRGIGFGLNKKGNTGGVIRNNTIIHGDNGDKFADTGIAVETSPNTVIEGNKIWLEHDYPNAIEYRFPATNNVIIRGNKVNKAITSRNNGKARLSNNSTHTSLKELLPSPY